ncbi:hypothetical protein MPTK1_1g00980 [Marchantia polymorpha subsp. ruderalis]|uniref:Uncharacterized protein n=2 Tax=Marchantia polymorpha TaxID=3197 RepID=A0AAF6AK52_MARPO|nr:hypothetical protein MARPO_0029s0148 [Marchantia polymorpha]BBM96822.1 hypothetical protein Mp_1g00980 [Marchantia polymorpha subsp. ruderalis]|eukprot:PTQ42661.1 hypothetical protein MARPO_0029s0148 [Marchantia polymorpha]
MLRFSLVVLFWTQRFVAASLLHGKDLELELQAEAEALSSKGIRVPPAPQPPLMFGKAGLVKRAWPELRFESVDVAKAKLRQSGVMNIYVLPPGADPAPTGFAVVNGTDQDVWLYPTGPSDLDILYEIPGRGLWHHNRTISDLLRNFYAPTDHSPPLLLILEIIFLSASILPQVLT